MFKSGFISLYKIGRNMRKIQLVMGIKLGQDVQLGMIWLRTGRNSDVQDWISWVLEDCS